MNNLKIMDYKGDLTETTIDLDKLEEILIIKIEVITGDEICTVIYENGDIKKIDSSNDRLQNYFDEEYILYNKKKRNKFN
jgi:hypothetical protein